MSVIHIPRRTYSRPAGLVEMSDMGMSLRASGWDVSSGQVIDVKRQRVIAPVRGAAALSALSSGPGLRPTANSNAVWDVETPATPDFAGAIAADNSAYAIIFQCVTHGNAGTNSPFISAGSTSDYNPFSVYQVGGSQVLGFGSDEIRTTGLDLREFVGQTIICLQNASAREVWVGGRLIWSYPRVFPASGLRSQTIALLNFSSAFNQSRNPNATISSMFFVPTPIGDQGARDLSINPWQLFKAQPRRIYSFAPVISVRRRSPLLLTPW